MAVGVSKMADMLSKAHSVSNIEVRNRLLDDMESQVIELSNIYGSVITSFEIYEQFGSGGFVDFDILCCSRRWLLSSE